MFESIKEILDYGWSAIKKSFNFVKNGVESIFSTIKSGFTSFMSYFGFGEKSSGWASSSSNSSPYKYDDKVNISPMSDSDFDDSGIAMFNNSSIESSRTISGYFEAFKKVQKELPDDHPWKQIEFSSGVKKVEKNCCSKKKDFAGDCDEDCEQGCAKDRYTGFDLGNIFDKNKKTVSSFNLLKISDGVNHSPLKNSVLNAIVSYYIKYKESPEVVNILSLENHVGSHFTSSSYSYKINKEVLDKLIKENLSFKDKDELLIKLKVGVHNLSDILGLFDNGYNLIVEHIDSIRKPSYKKNSSDDESGYVKAVKKILRKTERVKDPGVKYLFKINDSISQSGFTCGEFSWFNLWCKAIGLEPQKVFLASNNVELLKGDRLSKELRKCSEGIYVEGDDNYNNLFFKLTECFKNCIAPKIEFKKGSDKKLGKMIFTEIFEFIEKNTNKIDCIKNKSEEAQYFINNFLMNKFSITSERIFGFKVDDISLLKDNIKDTFKNEHMPLILFDNKSKEIYLYSLNNEGQKGLVKLESIDKHRVEKTAFGNFVDVYKIEKGSHVIPGSIYVELTNFFKDGGIFDDLSSVEPINLLDFINQTVNIEISNNKYQSFRLYGILSERCNLIKCYNQQRIGFFDYVNLLGFVKDNINDIYRNDPVFTKKLLKQAFNIGEAINLKADKLNSDSSGLRKILEEFKGNETLGFSFEKNENFKGIIAFVEKNKDKFHLIVNDESLVKNFQDAFNKNNVSGVNKLKSLMQMAFCLKKKFERDEYNGGYGIKGKNGKVSPDNKDAYDLEDENFFKEFIIKLSCCYDLISSEEGFEEFKVIYDKTLKSLKGIFGDDFEKAKKELIEKEQGEAVILLAKKLGISNEVIEKVSCQDFLCKVFPDGNIKKEDAEFVKFLLSNEPFGLNNAKKLSVVDRKFFYKMKRVGLDCLKIMSDAKVSLVDIKDATQSSLKKIKKMGSFIAKLLFENKYSLKDVLSITPSEIKGLKTVSENLLRILLDKSLSKEAVKKNIAGITEAIAKELNSNIEEPNFLKCLIDCGNAPVAISKLIKEKGLEMYKGLYQNEKVKSLLEKAHKNNMLLMQKHNQQKKPKDSLVPGVTGKSFEI